MAPVNPTQHFPKPVNLFIATPAYECKVCTNYHASSLNTWMVLTRMGVTMSERSYGGDGLIPRGRTHLLSDFLADPEATHIMWIDSDIGWEPKDIARMLIMDAPIVTAAYRKRTDNVVFGIRFFSDAPKLDKRGTLPVKYLLGGFTLCRRDAIETLIRTYPERRCKIADGGWHQGVNEFAYDFFPCPIDDDGTYLSEDYGFSILVRDAGIPIVCIPDVRLSHFGGKSFEGALADYVRFDKEME